MCSSARVATPVPPKAKKRGLSDLSEFAYLRLEDNPDLAALGGPFVLMTWIVAAERRNAQPDALDVPLSQDHLEQDRLLLEKVQSERAATPDP